jgi:hypothetical protein
VTINIDFSEEGDGAIVSANTSGSRLRLSDRLKRPHDDSTAFPPLRYSNSNNQIANSEINDNKLDTFYTFNALDYPDFWRCRHA